MKIRIKDNSVRFRLAQNEVSELVTTGETWSKCDFGNGTFVYGIKSTNAQSISCSFSNERVVAQIPETLLTDWHTDERVGFDHKENGLFVLIEKDWQCLKPRDDEDESNLYTHPAAK